LNKEGYEDFEEVLKRGTQEFSAEQFEEQAKNTSAIILDVRNQADFAKGHIPGSIFIGIDGGFAPWVGALIGDVKQPLLLVTPEGREQETITRLSRVGFDQTLGTLKGGFVTWKNSDKEIDSIHSVTAEEFKENSTDSSPIFDVRKPGEYTSEHLPKAKNTSLDFINEYLSEFPEQENFYIHCAGGYRSMIAASILKSRGIHNLIDVKGGFGAIKETGMEITDYICPSTL